MDPISITVAALAAIAGGAAGEVGSQAVTKLKEMVFHRGRSSSIEGRTPLAEPELIRLLEDPGSNERARELREALLLRASQDEEFSHGLAAWWDQLRPTVEASGDTHNSISGGTLNGPVLQGRDFSGVNFHMGAPTSRTEDE
ncbi:hypothetical protein ABZ883_03340 [Streptomyces sp. NPDC046977]|uniref:hypothetical protein n=1 Tax=Streptomyces sp. NPDC046977 TaxID=3154703 RepID=UPI0033E56449